ncbi:MAG TPA: tRNA pseudouridine(38-40) synthase TruA [Gammaproteobacteria bacterium]|nr:tRNA pseudouridine(38-40) synthase TruA [Gammaproteobacteria bacterium]
MSEVQRVALGLEYDGSRYRGWQVQTHADSVQARVEAALARIADHPVNVTCAGRTDAGVHALGQVVHFDTRARRPGHAWVLGGNSWLPSDISVAWARPVAPGFHARFSARWRRYRYVIFNRRARSGPHRDRACWHHHRLDVQVMRRAARQLLGRHDFSSFRAAACQARSPSRTVHAITLRRRGHFIIMDAWADGFLHHMVRNIAGTLMTVGRHERSPAWVAEVLAARDRRQAGITAPAQGLYFLAAGYPARFDLPPIGAPPGAAPGPLSDDGQCGIW